MTVANSAQKEPAQAQITEAERSAISSKVENMIRAQKSTVAEDYPPAVNEHGQCGSGEELAQTLEKIVTQIETIQKTLVVLD